VPEATEKKFLKKTGRGPLKNRGGSLKNGGKVPVATGRGLPKNGKRSLEK
jgi:hypothetical protein